MRKNIFRSRSNLEKLAKRQNRCRQKNAFVAICREKIFRLKFVRETFFLTTARIKGNKTRGFFSRDSQNKVEKFYFHVFEEEELLSLRRDEVKRLTLNIIALFRRLSSPREKSALESIFMSKTLVREFIAL